MVGTFEVYVTTHVAYTVLGGRGWYSGKRGARDTGSVENAESVENAGSTVENTGSTAEMRARR